MEQIASQGMSVGQLLQAGQQTTNLGIPLGTYFEDGKRRYVWAHVADATPRIGVVVRKNARDAQCVSVAGTQFTAAATNGRYGDGPGDTTIRAYGLSVVSASWVTLLQDGYFTVLSGTGIGVYPIDWIEVGGSGYTKFRIRGGLQAGLSTASWGKFFTNPYRNCIEFPGVDNCYLSGHIAAGVITQAATTSGYQLLQTRGIGLLRASNTHTINSGAGLGIVGSIVSTTYASTITVARSLGKKSISVYCPADIFIDKHA